MAVGYAYGFDKLTKLQVGQGRIAKWETAPNGCLINFSKREGWVYGKDAQGIGAWPAVASRQQQSQQQVGVL